MQNIINEYLPTGILALLLGASVIQISPIKINPWTWLFKRIGKIVNEEEIEKINTIEKRLDKHIQDNELDAVRNTRQRILRFDSECCRGEKHTLEHFNEILSDIDEYERYCDSHPNYKNSKAMSAIHTIKTAYEHCKEHNSFL